jgi:hypothetical protein
MPASGGEAISPAGSGDGRGPAVGLVELPCGPEVPGAEWVDEENYRRHVDAKRCEPRAVRRRVVCEWTKRVQPPTGSPSGLRDHPGGVGRVPRAVAAELAGGGVIAQVK